VLYGPWASWSLWWLWRFLVQPPVHSAYYLREC